MPGPMGDAAIPVEFSIPSDAYESNQTISGRQGALDFARAGRRSGREFFG